MLILHVSYGEESQDCKSGPFLTIESKMTEPSLYVYLSQNVYFANFLVLFNNFGVERSAEENGFNCEHWGSLGTLCANLKNNNF